jgi:hypothetical protein
MNAAAQLIIVSAEQTNRLVAVRGHSMSNAMKRFWILFCLCSAATEVSAAGTATSRIDTDGDGRYSLDELQKLYPALTQAVYARIDTDGDGRVSPGEFRAGQDEGLLVVVSSGG